MFDLSHLITYLGLAATILTTIYNALSGKSLLAATAAHADRAEQAVR